MRTILISGTSRPAELGVHYSVFIWAAQEGEQIQFITAKGLVINGYTELWALAKSCVLSYFGDELFLDGAYTQYLDHLISIQ